MEELMLGAGYVGSLAASSFWAGEWARRKGLSVKRWGLVGAATGPLAVVAVGLHKAEASLCPHCKKPIRFEERYCSACRALEAKSAVCAEDAAYQGEMHHEADTDYGVLLPHGFFEAPAPHFHTAIHAH